MYVCCLPTPFMDVYAHVTRNTRVGTQPQQDTPHVVLAVSSPIAIPPLPSTSTSSMLRYSGLGVCGPYGGHHLSFWTLDYYFRCSK